MLTTRDLLLGILLPSAISALVLTIAWRVTRRRLGQRDSQSWAGPLAIGLGFAGAWLALFGPEKIPPGDATGWLFVAVVPLGLLGSMEACWRFPPPARLGSAIVAAGTLLWLLAEPLITRESYVRAESLLTLSIAAPLVVGWIVATDQFARRVSSVRVSAILFMAALPAALALGHSGSQRLAQIAAALAATQAGTLAASLWLGTASAARGVALVFGALYGGLLVCGHWYAELSTPAAFGLLVAPCLAWLVEPWARRLGQRRTAAVQLLLVAAVAGAALWSTWHGQAEGWSP